MMSADIVTNTDSSMLVTATDNHDVPVNFAFLQQLEAAMMQAMVIHGFRIHERQRQMKSEVALLTDVSAIAEYSVV